MAALTLRDAVSEVKGKLNDTKADKVNAIAKLEADFNTMDRVSEELRGGMSPEHKPKLDDVFSLLKLHHKMMKLADRIAHKCEEVAKLPNSAEYYERANLYRALAYSIDKNEIREETDLFLHIKKEQMEAAKRKE